MKSYPVNEPEMSALLKELDALMDQIAAQYIAKRERAGDSPGVLGSADLKNGVGAIVTVGSCPTEMLLGYISLWLAVCDSNGMDPADLIAELPEANNAAAQEILDLAHYVSERLILEQDLGQPTQDTAGAYGIGLGRGFSLN